ncbi:MAG: peptidoglycan binding protein CsiV [Vibrionaceae bacterium]
MKSLLVIFFCILSFPSHAARWFDVELIVFKHKSAPSSGQEQWPTQVKPINMSNVVSLYNDDGLARYSIKKLSKSQLMLTEHYQKLASSSRYQPLLHVGWRQNDNGRNSMPKIRVTAGERLDAGNSDINPYELDGYIRLYVQHYLFLETDLALFKKASHPITPPVAQSDHGDAYAHSTLATNSHDSFLQAYPFQEKRRMRSGEIHYLDHPYIGLIINVRRAE